MTIETNLADLRNKAQAEGGFTEYECPQCNDIFWGGRCQCADNYVDDCDDCGKHFDDCHCEKYAWLNDMAIERSRRTIAFAQCPPWDGGSLVDERISLAEKLGHETAADEMRAQHLVYGYPGPTKPEPTEAEVAAITEKRDREREWLVAHCTADELAEFEREPTPVELAQELAELNAHVGAAHITLAESQFGNRKWSPNTWSYIDVLLGADPLSIARVDAARKEAQDKYFRDFNRKMQEQRNAKGDQP